METSQPIRETASIAGACDGESFLSSNVLVPHHVVYRSFPSETVMLNLQTGKYHGLNTTAGAMLAALEQAASVREAVELIARAYERPGAEVEQDMRGLCGALVDRELIELDDAASD
ncbi:MAG TPA: PqqD family protein [Solirubrobacteraceae bacterium]|nr:PqqD family protein [Solirubrobacteraceae bacterium]